MLRIGNNYLSRFGSLEAVREEVVKEELGSLNVQAPGEPLKKNNPAITFISAF